MALTLMPSGDIVEVLRRQRRTTDARRLSDAKGMPPFGSVKDVSESCDRAAKGAMLSTRELLEIARVLRSSRVLVDYLQNNKPFETSLDEVFSRLLPNRYLEERITRSILSEDMIADEASRELAEIRRKIRDANSRIKETLQRYISGSYSKILQENIVTVRNGRYVIPVKAECKNEMKGLIHDTSSSGATIFVEPMAIVDANNELRMLQSKEEHEIEKILFSLSADVSAAAESLRLNYWNITELAFIFACGRLAERMNATEPEIVSERRIELLRARHPLIDKDRVVPVTVSLGGAWDEQMILDSTNGVDSALAGAITNAGYTGVYNATNLLSLKKLLSQVIASTSGSGIKGTSEFIVGTQGSSTNEWTGVSEQAALTDGMQITYYLPYEFVIQ